MHSVDGLLTALRSKAWRTAESPKLLSILGNIATTSQETSKVPCGSGPLELSSSNLLIKSVCL